jgi:hypothetical protein
LCYVSGWGYSWGMAKHEVVNEILEYLDLKRTQLSNEMASVSYQGSDYIELEAMYDVYDHLIAKLEDDYR